jgi:hypothetical protein
MIYIKIWNSLLLFFSFIYVLTACSNSLSSREKYNLYNAVKNGNIEMVKKAIISGVDPDLYVEGHRSLIFAAVKAPTTEVLEYLISVGADVNAVDPGDKATPLIVSLVTYRCEPSIVLLKSGAKWSLKYQKAGLAGLGELTGLSAKEIMNLNHKYYKSDCWEKVQKLMN